MESKHPVPVPALKENSLKAGPCSETTVHTLPEAKKILAGKIIGAVGSDADEGTEFVVIALAKRLPEASLAKVFESLVANRATIKHRGRYAVGALQSEFLERAERR